MQMDIDFSLKNALKWRESSRAEFEQAQIPLLRKHLAHAYRTPYYKRIIDSLNINIDQITSRQDLRRFPLTSRVDI